MHHVELAATALHFLQPLRNIGFLHEAIMQHRTVETVAQIVDLTPLVAVDIGTVGNQHGEDHHAFVQHLVVLDIVQQCARHAGGLAGHEDRSARHAGCRILRALGENLDRQRGLAHPVAHQFAPARPGREQRECHETDHQREPAAVGDLGQIGREIGAVDDQEEGHHRECDEPFPFPHPDEQHAHQQRIDRHRAGHRDAIGCREVRRGLEGQHEDDHRDHQRPVDHRNVDLARLGFAGVADRQARHEAQLHGLVGNAEGARDHRLAGDEGRHGRQDDQRQAELFAGKQEERVAHHFGGLFGRQASDHSALSEIVEQQAWHHEAEPRQTHRSASEMAHVRIERFGPRHCQHHGAKREEGHRTVGDEEHHRVIGVQRPQDIGVLDDLVEAEPSDGDEIDDHHRREECPHLGRTPALQQEQEDKQDQRDGDHERVEPRIDHGKPFDRGQHRNRRRDHAVAVEQRSRKHAEQDDQPAIARLADMAAEQRDEREAAALPLVVRAHQDGNILDRDDDQHRPEDQADDAQDVQPVDRNIRCPGEGFAKGV